MSENKALSETTKENNSPAVIKEKPKTILLLSGGLGSLLMLHNLVEAFGAENVTCLHFTTKVTEGEELTADHVISSIQAKLTGAEFLHMNISKQLFKDASSEQELPEALALSTMIETGSIIAHSMGFEGIATGIHDNVAGMRSDLSALNLSIEGIHKLDGKEINSMHYLLGHPKAEVVRSLSPILETMPSISCTAVNVPCGECPKCLDRRNAFFIADVPNYVIYSKTPELSTTCLVCKKEHKTADLKKHLHYEILGSQICSEECFAQAKEKELIEGKENETTENK